MYWLQGYSILPSLNRWTRHTYTYGKKDKDVEVEAVFSDLRQRQQASFSLWPLCCRSRVIRQTFSIRSVIHERRTCGFPFPKRDKGLLLLTIYSFDRLRSTFAFKSFRTSEITTLLFYKKGFDICVRKCTHILRRK